MKLIWIFKSINYKFKFGDGQFMFVLRKKECGIFDLLFTKAKKIFLDLDLAMLSNVQN